MGGPPELSPEYAIETLSASPFDEEDVIALWVGTAAMPAAEARRRVSEVLLVAVHREAGLAGVTTAYLETHPQLLHPCWFQRIFVAPDHRRSYVNVHLSIDGIALLEQRFVSGEDLRGRCVIHELESRILRGRYRSPHEPLTGMTYIGENLRGDPTGVHYFPGALAPISPPEG